MRGGRCRSTSDAMRPAKEKCLVSANHRGEQEILEPSRRFADADRYRAFILDLVGNNSYVFWLWATEVPISGAQTVVFGEPVLETR